MPTPTDNNYKVGDTQFGGMRTGTNGQYYFLTPEEAKQYEAARAERNANPEEFDSMISEAKDYADTATSELNNNPVLQSARAAEARRKAEEEQAKQAEIALKFAQMHGHDQVDGHDPDWTLEEVTSPYFRQYAGQQALSAATLPLEFGMGLRLVSDVGKLGKGIYQGGKALWQGASLANATSRGLVAAENLPSLGAGTYDSMFNLAFNMPTAGELATIPTTFGKVARTVTPLGTTGYFVKNGVSDAVHRFGNGQGWSNAPAYAMDALQVFPAFSTVKSPFPLLQQKFDWALKKGVNFTHQRADLGGPQLQELAVNTANRYGADYTPINYKKKDKIIEKVDRERRGLDGGDPNPNFIPSDLKDAVRTTIYTPNKEDIPLIVKDLEGSYGYMRTKPQDTSMGYTGTIVNVKTWPGLTGEIQVNTPEMIYAKEKPEDAIRILDAEKWNEIFKKTGIEGGKGHKYYKEARILPKGDPKLKELEKISQEYYSHFK